MKLIEINNIYFRYPNQSNYLFKDFTLSIESGDIIRVIGRNGTGKSTLLKIISGELMPNSGYINRNNSKSKYLDQSSYLSLANNMTILEHFLISNRKNEKKSDVMYSEYKFLLQNFDINLESRISDFVGNLSGGQRQIVSLLSTIISNVQVICLDEFMTYLDETSRKECIAIIKHMFNKQKFAIIEATHTNETNWIECTKTIEL